MACEMCCRSCASAVLSTTTPVVCPTIRYWCRCRRGACGVLFALSTRGLRPALAVWCECVEWKQRTACGTWVRVCVCVLCVCVWIRRYHVARCVRGACAACACGGLCDCVPGSACDRVWVRRRTAVTRGGSDWWVSVWVGWGRCGWAGRRGVHCVACLRVGVPCVLNFLNPSTEVEIGCQTAVNLRPCRAGGYMPPPLGGHVKTCKDAL